MRVRNRDGSLLEERSASGTRYYVIGMHQSVTGIIDSTGSTYASYLYGPYGDTSANAESGGTTATNNPWRWDGGYQDAAEGDNLYHFGARYYDSSTAQWTQPDPKAGSISNPASLSAFVYGQGDPIDQVDRSGKGNIDAFSNFLDLGAIVGDLASGDYEDAYYEAVGVTYGLTVGTGCSVLIGAESAFTLEALCVAAGVSVGAWAREPYSELHLYTYPLG
jgi:RHS repeat-associated protein